MLTKVHLVKAMVFPVVMYGCESWTIEKAEHWSEKKVKAQVIQLCLTLCDPMNYMVHGILQARILEWVTFSFSRGSSQPRDQTQVSRIAGRFFNSWATREALLNSAWLFPDTIPACCLYDIFLNPNLYFLFIKIFIEALKNWWFWTMVLEKTLESPLNCKEIQPVNSKGN